MRVASVSPTPTDDVHPYRAVPLSTKQIAFSVVFLLIFSIIYLLYAQYHKILFYVMTSLIALWIMFIYTAGIFCVLYMIFIGYDDKFSNKVKDSRTIEEESEL